MENRIKTLTYKGKRHLPLPTGPYTVGCCDIMTSYLIFGVFIRLYYPSKDQGELEHYLQWPLWVPHKEYLNGYAHRIGVPPQLYKLCFHLLVGDLHIPAIWQAPIQPSAEKYPLIVFSHGLTGWRTTYSALCLELVSHGFVVAAIEHRDHSASASFYKKQARMSAIGQFPGASLCDLDDPDGRWDLKHAEQDIGPFCQAQEWMLYQKPTKENEAALRSRQLRHRVKECLEVLDLLENLNKGKFISNVLDPLFNSSMFKEQFDLKKVFFIGHSFGGATGILTMATELRFKAGIFLDPWMFPFYEDQSNFQLISHPFLCILIKSFQTKTSFRVIKQLQDSQDKAQFIVIKDALHRDLSDTPFAPKYSFSFSTRAGFRIEKFSALDLSADIILEYLGQHLGKKFRISSSKLELLKRKHLRPENYISKYCV